MKIQKVREKCETERETKNSSSCVGARDGGKKSGGLSVGPNCEKPFKG